MKGYVIEANQVTADNSYSSNWLIGTAIRSIGSSSGRGEFYIESEHNFFKTIGAAKRTMNKLIKIYKSIEERTGLITTLKIKELNI